MTKTLIQCSDSVAFNTGEKEKAWYRSDDRELELFMFKAYRDWY